jgi:hypothetical protein
MGAGRPSTSVDTATVTRRFAFDRMRSIIASDACLLRASPRRRGDASRPTLRPLRRSGEASVDDLDVYARISGNMRRLLESVGLQRRPRAINGPSLSDLMRDDLRRQQKAAEESA